MFEIIFDDSGNFVKRDVVYLIPVLKNIENLIYSWSEMRIWSKKMPHQILHFLADFPFSILYIGVDYAKLSLLLKRMKAIV